MNANPLNEGKANGGREAVILSFLQENYNLYLAVTKASTAFSVYSSEHSVGALAKLRDVTYHLFSAANTQDQEELAHHLSEAQETLRRAGQETLQMACEQQLVALEGMKSWYFIRTALYRDVISEREFAERLDQIK
jgi:hypothetical protein